MRATCLALSLIAAPALAQPAFQPDPPPTAERTASGLALLLVKPGTGPRPGTSDWVTIRYKGWLRDGKLFDDTARLDEPLQLPLAKLMKGLSEGLTLMAEGETRRLWIPEALAFAGAKGKPAGDLVMEVELVAVDPPPTQAPADLQQPPSDARLTKSGLVIRTLRPGKGERPRRGSRVTVHYTGWTLDGRMFDSSVARRSVTSFRLDEVIKGWTEGLQLMAKGEKARLWIPEKLAYRGERGKPAGMLVFDVELLDFRD